MPRRKPKTDPVPDAAPQPRPTKRVAGRKSKSRKGQAGLPFSPAADPAGTKRRRQPHHIGDAAYERQRLAAAEASAERSRRGRDIGEIPKVADQKRRDAALASFRVFLETYFPRVFRLKWSPDHILLIDNVESILRHGGKLAQGMPRGNGKTMILVRAPIYAALAKLRRYAVLVGATGPMALTLIKIVKSELSNNPLLAADFPEICHPVRCLRGISQRCLGQTYKGEQTHIEWSDHHVVLPTIADYGAVAVVIATASIEGAIRGHNHMTPDGDSLRPDVVVIDDPQTRESAKSPSQCVAREAIIEGDIVGLAGPDTEIAAFMGATVIERGDLADVYLDRRRKPEWRGVRCRAVRAMPTDVDRWDEYGRLLRESKECDGTGAEAQAYYLANRAAMDVGADITWPEQFPPSKVSALQHAMDRFYESRPSFFAELQNSPEPPGGEASESSIDAASVIGRLNGVPRGTVPERFTKLTGFVDIQKRALFWAVVAWQDDFTGAIVDYGCFPEQKSEHFAYANLRRTLSDEYPKANVNGQVFAALTALCSQLAGRNWPGALGESHRIAKILIDANWGWSTTLVHDVIVAHKDSSILMPSHGRAVGATDKPLSEYMREPGARVGLAWRVPPPKRRRTRRHVLWDGNFWKSFLAQRLSTPLGQAGAMTLPGKEPNRHRLLADHLAAERPVAVESRGRKIEEWKLAQVHRDNHWLDCVVGCAVAASMEGCALGATSAPVRVRRVKKSLAALQAKHRR